MKIKVAALVAFVWLLTGLALPARKIPTKPFFMPRPVTMDGAEIPEGMYQISLESNKSGVQVKLWKDGRFIATGHGAWVKNGVKYKDNAVLLQVNPDGSRSLLEIRLAGGTKSVLLDNHDTKLAVSAR